MRFLVANQPGTAGMKLLTSWLASTAATAMSVEIPDRGERTGHADGVHRGAAAGIGMSDAIVPMKMFNDSSVQ